jgi:hypothetical protein
MSNKPKKMKQKERSDGAGPSRAVPFMPRSNTVVHTLASGRAAIMDHARARSQQTMSEIIDYGHLEADDDVTDFVTAQQAKKAAHTAANRAKQLAMQPRPLVRATVPDEDARPQEAEATPQRWDEEEPFAESEADVVAPYIRDKKHSPASVLNRTVAENNHYIGVGEYTLVDVGATDSSEARAAKTSTLKYHGIAPGLFETDKPLPAGRGCTHTMQECDCAIPGRKVYLFNHTSYYMDAKAYERLELGSRVVLNEHDLEPGESVLSAKTKGAWLTKRSMDGEYFTYDNRGVLKFQNPPSPNVPPWWVLATQDKRPGSVVTVYDVGPKPAPGTDWWDVMWEFFKSFVIDETEQVLLRHGVGDIQSTSVEPGVKPVATKAHQRAQVLLMGVTTGGGVEEVTKSINRVARTLAHETGHDITEATDIVTATHEQVMRAQDHLFNVAHRTMVRADYRSFLRLKPWIRVLVIALSVSGVIGAHTSLSGMKGFALSQALAAIAFTATASLAAELKERYAVLKRTSK